jgi:Zn-dependent peptidase ImmA (M78 family)
MEVDCNTQTAWNGSYTYAEARNNTFYLASWTANQQQFNCTHEMGHCWSLGHDTRAASVMRQGQYSTIALDSGNVSDVNAKY